MVCFELIWSHRDMARHIGTVTWHSMNPITWHSWKFEPYIDFDRTYQVYNYTTLPPRSTVWSFASCPCSGYYTTTRPVYQHGQRTFCRQYQFQWESSYFHHSMSAIIIIYHLFTGTGSRLQDDTMNLVRSVLWVLCYPSKAKQARFCGRAGSESFEVLQLKFYMFKYLKPPVFTMIYL